MKSAWFDRNVKLSIWLSYNKEIANLITVSHFSEFPTTTISSAKAHALIGFILIQEVVGIRIHLQSQFQKVPLTQN